MWIVCQIGAREHYAIPRALEQAGQLGLLCTDAWIRPGSPWGRFPGTRRLRDRYHSDLAGAPVFAPNSRMLAFEIEQRLRKRSGWESIIARNTLFQQQVIRHLTHFPDPSGPKNKEPTTKNEAQRTKNSSPPPPTLFSYSGAALELFRFAKSRGWSTVLGQIDPGPEEESLVAEELRRYPHLKTSWHPTPPIYWKNWHREVELADRILVNSEWSRQCLLKEGVAAEKMEIVPLVYETNHGYASQRRTKNKEQRTISLLFLGMINLRKGVGRLLEAMRELEDEAIELTLAGPSDIDPAAWADLPKVKWVGPVPRSEVGRYYEAADLFILPTISDGYALTQLEALSHGLPVLASKSCGAAVTHGVNGWILNDLEPATIATAIRTAREALPLAKVEMPPFTLDDLAARLVQ